MRLEDVRLGIDFDNTLACYRRAFHAAAAGRGWVPAQPVLTKNQVRDRLRNLGREDDWTELQGFVYGPGMIEVEAFPGAEACLRRLRENGVELFIISHKTRVPYRGPAHDLHAAAWNWLEGIGFLDPGGLGFSRGQVFFETTLSGKLHRIAERGCTHFLDDLPELLAEPQFPTKVSRILFDPDDSHLEFPWDRIRSWAELEPWLERETP